MKYFIPLDLSRPQLYSRFVPKCILCTACVLNLLALGLSADAQQTERQTLEDLANPDRPRDGGEASEPIYIDYENVSLLDVIAAIGLQTGRNFEVDPNLANQKVTIISHHPVPPELAFDILESILASRNFSMIETLDGNLVKILPRGGQSGTDKLEIYRGSIPPLDGFDRFSIHIVDVRYADATEAAELLKRVGSENNEITVYQETNMIIIKDTADGVRNMLTLLEVIDIPGTGSSLEIFTLEYTRAEALAAQIQEVLLGEEGGRTNAGGSAAQRATPTTVRRQPRTAVVPGQSEAAVIGGGEDVLRMVPDERLNALIVVASEGLMEQTRFLIEQLDTPTPFEANNMHYVQLLNADAEAVVEALNAITSTSPRAGSENAAQSGEIQPFEKDIVITSYEPTNALLILATSQDFKLLESMISHLDVARRQVNVEAIILQVTISDAVSLSVETAALTESEFFGLSNAATIANVLATGPASLAGAGGTIGILGDEFDVVDPLSGETVSVQSVPFLLSALEQITDVEILSRPNLLAMDNTEAEITVGEEIPIISSQGDVNESTGFSSRAQVDRRDTGVRLSVTPQVNDGDYVSMEIEVEVSEAVDSAVGIDPNETGATISQALISSEVVVGDSETGIIGGLISESRTGSVSQIPFLGDLPLIGWMFRSRSKSRAKQNLVVLLTPHVVKRGEDFARITEQRITEFYDSNLDAIFEEGGLIKTIKAKKRARNRRPTDEYNPELNSEEDFGRSTIQR